MLIGFSTVLASCAITEKVAAPNGTEVTRTYEAYGEDLIRSDQFFDKDGQHYTCIWKAKRKPGNGALYNANYSNLLEVRENGEISMDVNHIDVCLDYLEI